MSPKLYTTRHMQALLMIVRTQAACKAYEQATAHSPGEVTSENLRGKLQRCQNMYHVLCKALQELRVHEDLTWAWPALGRMLDYAMSAGR